MEILLKLELLSVRLMVMMLSQFETLEMVSTKVPELLYTLPEGLMNESHSLTEMLELDLSIDKSIVIILSQDLKFERVSWKMPLL